MGGKLANHQEPGLTLPPPHPPSLILNKRKRRSWVRQRGELGHFPDTKTGVASCNQRPHLLMTSIK